MGMTLDSPGGPVSSQGPYKREREGQRQRDGRCCAAGCEDGGGAMSRDAAPLEAGKGKSLCSEKTSPAHTWIYPP